MYITVYIYVEQWDSTNEVRMLGLLEYHGTYYIYMYVCMYVYIYCSHIS